MNHQIKQQRDLKMHNFKRGTVLKLTCDVHEFLSKAPKAYEDLIDIIDEDGTVKVKTHNGDYVGFYGMKTKIHTRFMKQFVDVTPDKIEVPVIELDQQDIDGINEQVASLSTPDDELRVDSIMTGINVNDWLHSSDDEYNSTAELDKQLETLNPSVLTSEPIDYATIIGQSLLEEVTDSLAMAASKLNSLGYEFANGEWLNQEEVRDNKIQEVAEKISEMTTLQVACIFVDKNIEL